MLKKCLKYLIFSFIVATSYLNAGLVNAISVTVNGEPITLYEVHKEANLRSLSLRDALEELVQERLESSQIKKLGIDADAYEIHSRLEDIAKQNGISVIELKNFILSKNMDWEEYKLDIQKTLKQEKLYHSIFANTLISIEASEAKKFYDNNPNEFKRANNFELTQYDSSSEAGLKRILSSPMSIVSDVQTKQVTLSATELDNKTRYYIDQTPKGEFTPFLQTSDGFRMYHVQDKKDFETISFESVKDAIEGMLENKKREEAIENYFEKLKARADIVVLRHP